MCGIAGIFIKRRDAAPPATRAQLQDMASALRHRGPDEFGIYRDRRCGLAHSRLSIIDLVSGQQPLSTSNHDLWICFNGEIFNYIELREELIALGHGFRTRSDTEVALVAYQQWGNSAFERFNGQFAIAIWDRRNERLVLARDLAGILPLHVAETKDRVVFGSEVKAIFAANVGIEPELDPLGLEQTFTFWSIVPPHGVFRGIGEIEPGHVREFAEGYVRDSAFASHEFPTTETPAFRGSLGEATEAVRASLTEATRLRMVRADVPVGSYLSGGLDSSIVAALGCHSRGEAFHTFSLRFVDAEYDETEFQREMVSHVGSKHAERVVSRDDIANAFEQVVYHTERPILRTAPVPMYLLSGLVRESGIKVVLTGEGADEFFGGYDLFREAKVRRFWARHPESAWRPLLLDRLYPYLGRSPVAQRAMARRFFGRNLAAFRAPGFSHEMRWQGTSALKRMFSPELRAAVGATDVIDDLVRELPSEFSKWPFLCQDQYLEIRTLLAGYLLSSQGDRMLMGHSIEGRFPFLDPNVIALANSLPAEFKLRVLDEKHILKRASADLLPASILERKKQPYRAPDVLAFLGKGAMAWVNDVLAPTEVARAGVFETEAVRSLWNKCKERATDQQFSNTDNMALIGALSTQLLHKRLVESRPVTTPIQPKTIVDYCNE